MEDLKSKDSIQIEGKCANCGVEYHIHSNDLVPKWISIKDGLPKKYQAVNVTFKGKLSRVKGKVMEAWFNGEYWDGYAVLPGINEKLIVTHWQYLPEPAKQ